MSWHPVRTELRPAGSRSRIRVKKEKLLKYLRVKVPHPSPAAAEVWNATLRRQPLSFRAHQCLFQYPLAAERRGINGLIKDSQRPSWAPVSGRSAQQLKRRWSEFEERLLMMWLWPLGSTPHFTEQRTSWAKLPTSLIRRHFLLNMTSFYLSDSLSCFRHFLIFNMFKQTNTSSKFMRIKTIRDQNKSKESRQQFQFYFENLTSKIFDVSYFTSTSSHLAQALTC